MRIRLKSGGGFAGGNIIFDIPPKAGQVFSTFFATVRLRLGDARKTERLYSLTDTDSIDYL